MYSEAKWEEATEMVKCTNRFRILAASFSLSVQFAITWCPNKRMMCYGLFYFPLLCLWVILHIGHLVRCRTIQMLDLEILVGASQIPVFLALQVVSGCPDIWYWYFWPSWKVAKKVSLCHPHPCVSSGKAAKYYNFFFVVAKSELKARIFLWNLSICLSLI